MHLRRLLLSEKWSILLFASCNISSNNSSNSSNSSILQSEGNKSGIASDREFYLHDSNHLGSVPMQQVNNFFLLHLIELQFQLSFAFLIYSFLIGCNLSVLAASNLLESSSNLLQRILLQMTMKWIISNWFEQSFFMSFSCHFHVIFMAYSTILGRYYLVLLILIIEKSSVIFLSFFDNFIWIFMSFSCHFHVISMSFPWHILPF